MAVETQGDGLLHYRFTVHYDSAGRLERVDKLTTNPEATTGKSIQGTTEFEYESNGQIRGFVYADNAGRRFTGRYKYTTAELRPTQLELFVDDESVERIRYEYDGPRWREPLFLGTMSLHFGYARSFSDTGEGEQLFKTARLEPASGALLEPRYESGPFAGVQERYLYGDACNEL